MRTIRLCIGLLWWEDLKFHNKILFLKYASALNFHKIVRIVESSCFFFEFKCILSTSIPKVSLQNGYRIVSEEEGRTTNFHIELLCIQMCSSFVKFETAVCNSLSEMLMEGRKYAKQECIRFC